MSLRLQGDEEGTLILPFCGWQSRGKSERKDFHCTRFVSTGRTRRGAARWRSSNTKTREIKQGSAASFVEALDISLMVSLAVNELIKQLINQFRGGEQPLPLIVDPAEEHILQ